MQQIKMAAGDTWQPQEHRQRRSGENGGDGRHVAAAGAGFERDMCHCGAADHAWLRSGADLAAALAIQPVSRFQ